MFGSIRSLKPGQQGGGFSGKRKATVASSSSAIGPTRRPASRLASRQSAPSSLEAAIKEQNTRAEAERRGRNWSRHLPEWIAEGQRVGYLSSSGKICQGLIDSISMAKGEVRFVFAENPDIWKRVPFSTILSKSNPLRRLAAPCNRSRSMTDLLDAAQVSHVDKSIMLQRILGTDARMPASAKEAGEESRPVSVAPEPGSAQESVCSQSRSRSPRAVAAQVDGLKERQELPAWIAAGQRVGYMSKSSGKYCQVDIDTVSMDQSEVKIIFVENRSVWKGIPFSMILSDRNPLKPIAAHSSQEDVCIDLSE